MESIFPYSIFPMSGFPCGRVNSEGLLSLMRTVLFINALLFTIATQWVIENPSWTLGTLILLPLLLVLFYGPDQMLTLVVTVTSVEQLRSSKVVSDTLQVCAPSSLLHPPPSTLPHPRSLPHPPSFPPSVPLCRR